MIIQNTITRWASGTIRGKCQKGGVLGGGIKSNFEEFIETPS